MADQTPPSPGASGYGQYQPTDGNDPYNVNEFICNQLINKRVTCKIVQVMKVYSADGNAVSGDKTGIVGLTGTLSVQPLTDMQDGIGNRTPHGEVHGIPFSRVQGGANAIIADPQEGDIGLMVIEDRDISAVKTSRDQAGPGSFRTNNMADGMYVLSLLNKAPPVQWVRFRDDGLEFVDKNNNSYVTSPDGILITDSNGNTTNYNSAGITHTPVGLFKVVGDVQITGSLMGETGGTSVGLSTHTHAQGPDSHGDTEAETNPPTPGT
jgi:hypothetical protein